MRFIGERVRSAGPDEGWCEARVASGSLAACDGLVRPAWLVEIAAQATAAAGTAGATGGAAPQSIGMIVGASGWRFLRPARCDEPIAIHVRRGRRFGELSQVHAVLEQGGEEIARGDLTLHGG